jgi:carboxymethylenebutenolidase
MRQVAPLLGILLLATSAAASTTEDTTHFVSGGKKITVERFRPGKDGKYPALLLIHGSDGLAKRGDDYRAACRNIAKRGYIVLLVHLFDRCGSTYATKEAIDQNFFNWVRVIHDGISYAIRLPETDPARVGLIGYSLGAYLCLSSSVLALKPEHQAGAIIEYFGGLPKLLAWNARRIPPTLILHGEEDKLVPAQEARDLERFLQSAGVAHEVRIYARQGHGFDDKVSTEAMELGFKFLDKHLLPRQKPK